MSSRRQARRAVVAPVLQGSEDPNRVTQQLIETPWGEFHGWFKGGVCRRARGQDGRMYGWEDAPALWASLIDRTFRPRGHR